MSEASSSAAIGGMDVFFHSTYGRKFDTKHSGRTGLCTRTWQACRELVEPGLWSLKVIAGTCEGSSLCSFVKEEGDEPRLFFLTNQRVLLKPTLYWLFAKNQLVEPRLGVNKDL